jgi:hypothetical protein
VTLDDVEFEWQDNGWFCTEKKSGRPVCQIEANEPVESKTNEDAIEECDQASVEELFRKDGWEEVGKPHRSATGVHLEFAKDGGRVKVFVEPPDVEEGVDRKCPDRYYHKSESKVSDIAHEIIDLKVAEAIAKAELEVCTEHLSEAKDSGLAARILQDKLTEATETLSVMTAESAHGIQSKTKENDAILKVLEAKAKALAEAKSEIAKVTAKLDEAKQSLNEKHQEDLVTASTDAIQEGRKEVLAEYFDRQIKTRKLQVDENSRALLENCQNLQEVDSLMEKLVGIARRSALHTKPLTTVEIQEAKESDPEQDHADKTVGLMFKRLS